MRTLTLDNRTVQYQWASDVNFDGIRLEVLSDDREVLFDVSVPDDGPISIKRSAKRLPQTSSKRLWQSPVAGATRADGR
jgi:hypothetical protein